MLEPLSRGLPANGCATQSAGENFAQPEQNNPSPRAAGMQAFEWLWLLGEQHLGVPGVPAQRCCVFIAGLTEVFTVVCGAVHLWKFRSEGPMPRYCMPSGHPGAWHAGKKHADCVLWIRQHSRPPLPSNVRASVFTFASRARSDKATPQL